MRIILKTFQMIKRKRIILFYKKFLLNQLKLKDSNGNTALVDHLVVEAASEPFVPSIEPLFVVLDICRHRELSQAITETYSDSKIAK